MTEFVFLDTSGWWAVLDAREAQHAHAVTVFEELLRARTRFVTTNLVVAEVHALLILRRDQRIALQVLDLVRADPVVEVRYVDEELHGAAVDRWLRPFADQRFSLADAASFEIMRREGIRRAFALDRHFVTAGYSVLL